MSLDRVGGNEFVWTDYFLSRSACLPCNELHPNISGSECNFLELFLFRQFSAMCRASDSSLQAGLPGCPAKSSERLREGGHNELLDRSSCADIPRGNVDSLSFVGFSFGFV